ncbi:MAG: ATP-binding protein [Pseudomonadota bacterium]
MRRRIQASDEEVSALLLEVGRSEATLAAGPAAKGDMMILLGEVLNNVVEHAAVGRETTVIDVTLTFGARAIQVETVDDGHPLPGACLSSATLPRHDGVIDELPEGGFGWFIIHQIADDIGYERVDGRNCLTLSIAR